ncbi:MAG: transglycosylase SLT domain-containing protein [Magnetococcales bacterium]|nr:transglycosylase SLT domain-containing protein [Magnetococcales bacterium]MBF0322933.1 transglycosylase SLT domain-containing protein [Magnetococcales bacterium]
MEIWIRRHRWSILLPLLLTLLLSSGCASVPTLPAAPDSRPKNINDACALLSERDHWWKSLESSANKWGVPVHVQLAIIHQESKFEKDARPPRGKALWFVPWSHTTSAYGYAQALDGTWEWYQNQTGNRHAYRDDFDDAVDFIGWYCNKSNERLGIDKWDTYNQYLAYHEGHNGFAKKSWLKKPWLVQVAAKVKRNAERYRGQMLNCNLKGSKSWWSFM